MRSKYLLIILTLCLGLVLMNTACTKQDTPAKETKEEKAGNVFESTAMLTDDEPAKEMALSKAMAASDKPVPIPGEPPLFAKPDIPTASSMMMDLEPAKDLEAVPGAETKEAAKPVPIPEELPPPKK